MGKDQEFEWQKTFGYHKAFIEGIYLGMSARIDALEKRVLDLELKPRKKGTKCKSISQVK